MTTAQTLPECFPHDPKRAADERARWLAVYGAAFAQLAIHRGPRPNGFLCPEDFVELVSRAECVADLEAEARAAWEAEQVRKLDDEEGP